MIRARSQRLLSRLGLALGAALVVPACVMDLSDRQHHPDCCEWFGLQSDGPTGDPLGVDARFEPYAVDAIQVGEAGEACSH